MAVRILESTSASSAWCIDTSGNVYKCYVHPFGSLEDDALEDAAWLVCNNFSSLADLCVNYYVSTMWLECNFGSGQLSLSEFLEEVDDSVYEIECLKGNFYRDEFINMLHRAIESRFNLYGASDEDIDDNELERDSRRIKRYLNNHILRVRFGSEFQTVTSREGSLYFRISSSGFDWYSIIIRFIDQLSQSRKIRDVTVERDYESTGSHKVYADHLSLDEFLLNKSVVMEALNRCEY